MTPTSVWDASALLMVLQQEPGWKELADSLERAAMSAVNVSEVASHLHFRGASADEVREYVSNLPFQTVAFTEERAFQAAALRPTTRDLGLSLGDRACLALARELALPAVTADRIWAEVDLGIEIQLAR